MTKKQPSVTAAQKIVCAEVPAPPAAMIVFGASGDLAHRKLVVGLFQLFQRELLSDNFYFLGCGRKKLTDEDFRLSVKQAIEKKADSDNDAGQIEIFLNKIYYSAGNYDDISFYNSIKDRLAELDKKHNLKDTHIFYLSVPPEIYTTIIKKLHESSLSCTEQHDSQTAPRLVVEKPFGRDYDTATELDAQIHHCFNESQIYRIDHYLGKETVQNILMFRFANAIFEPIWNRNYIDHIQITIAESLGIEHRAGYYEKSGALRDMFQNHILQMLALVAMEPPNSFNADHIRDEKNHLLSSIRPIDIDKLDEFIVRGQYTSGTMDSVPACGYIEEQGVSDDSKIETFVAAKLFVDNWRWKDVPFYLRTGKRLAHKDTEIAITFKDVPHSMFEQSGIEKLPPNVLVIQIQPEESLSLSFQAKSPGSKLCMTTLTMDFNYNEVFAIEPPDAYQRLLLDCMTGDQTLFARKDGVEIAWKLWTPVLKAWENGNTKLHLYAAGSYTFPEADKLIQADGRTWRKLAAK